MKISRNHLFRELYMSTHWISFIALTVFHFQWQDTQNPLVTFFLILFVILNIAELYLCFSSSLNIKSHPLIEYFQGFADLFILVFFTLAYPQLYSVSLLVLCTSILLYSFQSNRNSALVQGIAASCAYGFLSVKITQNTVDFNMWIILSQSLGLVAFSFVIHEVNLLIHSILMRNQHAMNEIAYKNELLEKSVKTDFLTDLYNHQAFYHSLEVIAMNYVPIVLILFDIDNFKSINDQYGHVTGDYVIREVAQVIKQHLRTNDIAARYGGEEFAILLPSAKLHEGEQVAERIRLAISEYAFELDGVKIQVTVSGGLGISSVCLSKQDQSLFVDHVDDLLYCSKRNGKNQITIARQPILI